MSKILLAHGSGGRLSRQLIDELIRKEFNNPILDKLLDSAVLNLNGNRLCFTTDSYVVKPLFFPGGDIGKLAVCGTVNDLVVTGARPLYLSAAIIMEEGLDREILEKVVSSMSQTAQEAGVLFVTGDTKVVEKGGMDKLFINTSGIGIVERELAPEHIRCGDAIIVTGTLGEHSIAVLCAREDMGISSDIISDCAPLQELLLKVLDECKGVRFMRDITRGGLATILNEISLSTGFGISIKEEEIPVKEDVLAVCELLGLDPLYLANEGRAVLVVSGEEKGEVLRSLKKNPLGKDSRIIGEVVKEPPLKVIMKTSIKGSRIIDMLTGEQLPRIC